MDVLKTAILQYITTAEKGETLKDVGEYLLLIASLLNLSNISSKGFDLLNEILRYNMQMVYELQPKAGVEVGMAALRFIHNEIFLQKNDRSQSHDNLIDSILSGILDYIDNHNNNEVHKAVAAATAASLRQYISMDPPLSTHAKAAKLMNIANYDSVASNHIPHTPSVSWRSTDSIEMGRGVGSMGNHSMGWLPVYSPSHFSDRLSSHRDFSDRLSSPRPSSEQHSDSEESAASEETWMHELKQDLEGKVGQEIGDFLLNYDYLVNYDDGVIPTILPYPYLRDNHYFTEKDVKAIQEYLKFIINSLLDLKIGKDRVTRTYISKAIKSYRNTLESYLALRNSRIENGKRKGPRLPPYDSPYKPSRSVMPNGSRYNTRQKMDVI